MEAKKISNQDKSRRDFIKTSAVVGAGLAIVPTFSLFSQNQKNNTMSNNIKSKGYAGTNDKNPLTAWEFERRPVGDNDILIEIKFSGICHSDIHQIQGHWGPQQYPQVPGHEIAGIVTAVGRNVTKFKVGDKAGVAVWLTAVPLVKMKNSINQILCSLMATQTKESQVVLPKAVTQTTWW